MLFRDAGDGLLLVDASGCVLAANPAARRLLDAGAGEIASGAPYWALFPAPASEHLAAAWSAAAEQVAVADSEDGGTSAALTLHIERDVMPGRHLVRIRDWKAPLDASRGTLRSMADLAARVAHDFNNTLTIVQNLAALLRDELPDGPQREDADAILESAAEGAEMTRALSVFGAVSGMHGRPGDKTPAHLDDVLANGLRVLRCLLPKRTQIETDLSCDAFPVNEEATLQMLVLWLQHVGATLPEAGRVHVGSRRDQDASGAPTALLTLEAEGAVSPDDATLSALTALLAGDQGGRVFAAGPKLSLRLRPIFPPG